MATNLEKWVDQVAGLTEPKDVYFCDGSQAEAQRLIERGINEEKLNGKPVFARLNHKNWPNSFLHRSHPNDVARTENLTFVCHDDAASAGPNNNWMAPVEAKARLTALTRGCMRNRTMYVMPFVMGHPDSPYAKFCCQVTDSTYVAVSMRIMTRMGKTALERIGNRQDFLKGLHSVGELDPNKRFIMHFPQDNLVWSIGSGYGGNALLGKKCIALRLASCIGKKEGWLAEHMIIIGIEDPQGKITYLAAALPSACGKTNLAMLRSSLPGYKVWTLGDDIAWLWVDEAGHLRAANPEAGFFGVAPGTSANTNPLMLDTLKAGSFFPTLFTNTALDNSTNEPWWEDLTKDHPADLLDWQGNRFDLAAGAKAAHANSRFTVSIVQCPTLSQEYNSPQGVPISAIILGGRRTSLMPLVYESFDWQHGTFCGATMGSETTAAQAGATGLLRRDPMAMLPFCGYNMGDYFEHWLEFGKRLKNPPKIFLVNWFRKDEAGRFLWPGFSDNIRVLKWAIERCAGKAQARETAIGFMPESKDMDLSNLDMTEEKFAKLFAVDKNAWNTELKDVEGFFAKFAGRIPQALRKEFDSLVERLKT